ncbi:MAG TPA: hypothetical protein VFZ25_09440 [Chloroflexota bacterium]|nr:hypothetical protein [Chloroflexota bacterium]
MAFNFREKLVDEYGDIDDDRANRYIEELEKLFAESPEAEALRERGIEAPEYLTMFLDYALRYTGSSPAAMSAGDIKEALSVFAQKVTGQPEDLDRLIPELEAFCDFARRAFALTEAVAWKREIQSDAAWYGRALRDPHQWGMAKSMMMEGMARGYDLGSEASVNEWMQVLQSEQLARIRGAEPPTKTSGAASEASNFFDVYGDRVPVIWETGGKHPSGPYGTVPQVPPKQTRAKAKSKRKQSEASRRRNRRR